MILQCKHKNGAHFEIDTANNTLTWDTKGHNRKGQLYFTIAELPNETIIFVNGIKDKNKYFTQYISPSISIYDIEDCNNWAVLHKVFHNAIAQFKPLSRHNQCLECDNFCNGCDGDIEPCEAFEYAKY